jgi:hypothetical protein
VRGVGSYGGLLIRETREARMPQPFNGIINIDIRDSTPDWLPFEPPRAPDGAPNVERQAEMLMRTQ